jgi:hypothetical protein
LLSAGAAAFVLIGLVPAGSAAAAPGGQPRPAPYQEHLRIAAQRVAQAHAVRALVTKEDDDGAEDPEEIAEQAEQYAEARSAPGVVAPGAYTAAWQALQTMPVTRGAWQHVTNLPYNADDPRYRDINSNSSGGAGLVTGRITGLASDDSGDVYAGAANGGVWRSRTGGGNWQPIADRLPSPSTGDLRLDAKGRLWYATGEANTGATAFVGSGVYVLRDPRTGSFSPRDRVGGTELESTVIRELRIFGDTVWAATNHGAYSHSVTDLSGPWKLQFAPNPAFLAGGAQAADPNAPYKNIINDFAADPRNPAKVIIAAGWRSGDAYNGFYTRTAGGWQRTTLAGDIASDAANVGAVTFAAAADGSRVLRHRAVSDAAGDQPGQHPAGRLRVQVGLAVRAVDPVGGLQEAGRVRVGADRSGLHARHPGLVQPVPAGRPDRPRPRVRGSRGGLRVDERGRQLDHSGPVLELRFSVLEHRPGQADRRLFPDAALRPARGDDRLLPRQEVRGGG